MTLIASDFSSSNGYLFYRGWAIHRLAAQYMLGRDLLPDEVVHHANGNKLDARPSNLQILKRYQHHAGLAPCGAAQVIILPPKHWLKLIENVSHRPQSETARLVASCLPMLKSQMETQARHEGESVASIIRKAVRVYLNLERQRREKYEKQPDARRRECN